MGKIFEKIVGKEFSLRERLFRLIVAGGTFLSAIGALECIVVMNLDEMVIPFGSLFLVMLIGAILTFKYRKLDFAAVLVALVIIVIVFPFEFMLCGGVNGGAGIWFVLEFFYLFMMFSGKKLGFFLILTVAIDVFVYVLSYLHPEMVVPMTTPEAVYIDSLFAVLAVGFAGGLIIKFQMYLFEEERTIVLHQKEALEEAGNSKNAFFAKISHEIRTPINAIIGLNEMVLRENADGNTREYAKNIKSASKMLLSLVNDILDLSRIESRRMEIFPGAYQTKDLFRELIDMILVSMKEKKLELFVDIDETIPSVLHGDEKRIKQVLLNILANAVKYTKEGSVTLSAKAEKVGENTVCLKISVADTGIGIRKEDLPYLYDAFSRADEKRNLRTEGNGLGLSIVKQLVELMDGKISVDSIYRKGTVFTVELEQEIIDALPIGNVQYLNAVREETEETYKQLFEASEARILLVDDNEMNAYVIKKLLEATRVTVDVARSGEACLEQTKQKFYHIILMDYMMPKLNGSETLKQLRMQRNGLCKESVVILMTANTLEETQRLMRGAHFDGYLEKPIDSRKLEEEILRFLPEEIIEYRKDAIVYTGNENVISKITKKKRKNIYITTDCVCDLPEYLLKRHDIKVMYLYIKTKHGRFADTREIDSDNLSQYLTESGSEAVADSVSVEEFEAFFADALTEADQVIHISMAKNAGKTYGIAKKAAEGFDHVHVIDAGHTSGGQGLVVLHAARLVESGYYMEEICEEIEKMKGQVVSKFLLPSADIFSQRGYLGRSVASICRLFGFYPIVATVKSRITMVGVFGGSIENAWKLFIHFHMHRKKKINTDIVILTYVSCSVKEQEFIREQVLRFLPFKEVIMQKASFTNACNSGIRTLGIAYYINP